MTAANGRAAGVAAALAEKRRRRINAYVGHKQHGTMTAGEAAKICGVAPRTVSKWIDSGLLPAWRFPDTGGRPDGQGDRRVERADLMAFLARHKMQRAIAALRADMGVLLVGCNPPPQLPAWAEPIPARCPAEAGALFERLVPPWAVIDAQALGVPEAVSVADWLSRQAVAPAVLILAHPETESERLGGFDHRGHPVDAADLAAWLGRD